MGDWTCATQGGEPTPIRKLCVDDHPALRSGIAAMIANHDDMTIVGEAAL